MGALDSLQTFFNKVGGLVTAADAFSQQGRGYPMAGYGMYGMYGPSVWTVGGCFGGQQSQMPLPSAGNWDSVGSNGGYTGAYSNYGQYGNGSQACQELQNEINAAIANAGKSLTGSQAISAGQASPQAQNADADAAQTTLSDNQKAGLDALKTGNDSTIADEASDKSKYNSSLLAFSKELIKSMNNNADADGLSKEQFTALYKSYLAESGKTDAQLSADAEKAFNTLNIANDNDKLDEKEVAVMLAALDEKDSTQGADGQIKKEGAKAFFEQLTQATDTASSFIYDVTNRLFGEDQA